MDSNEQKLVEQLAKIEWRTQVYEKGHVGLRPVPQQVFTPQQIEIMLPAIRSHTDALVRTLRSVCAEAYQMAGVYGAPVKALDNLAAAASGRPIPHETFLPINDEHTDALILAAYETCAKSLEYLSHNGILCDCRKTVHIPTTWVEAIRSLTPDSARRAMDVREVQIKSDEVKFIREDASYDFWNWLKKRAVDLEHRRTELEGEKHA